MSCTKIVELKYNHHNPTLDNHIFYYPEICKTPQTGHEFTQNVFSWGSPHTFKCIWTPTRIEFWVDDTKLKQVNNTGQSWYPQLSTSIILSQQITRTEIPQNIIITPQTSTFNWVKAREFFLAPQITCPSNICSTGSVTMDVDSKASNISWQLSPSSLFSTTSGTGSTANIIAANNVSGVGKIIYTFQMPSGESFTA